MHPARTALTLVAAAASVGGLGFVTSPAAQAAGDAGAVYVLSNQTAGNAVLAYTRSADGTLTFDHGYPTTGTGTGGGLGSQGAVIVDDAEAHLYAVDAGSSTITSFRITDIGLDRVGTVPSGGTTPTSLTVHGELLYVLNMVRPSNFMPVHCHRWPAPRMRSAALPPRPARSPSPRTGPGCS